MMTPSQVREYEFKQSGRNAYKADDVDAFIAELSVDYEKMFRENGELIKRASLLADRLEKYKNDEGDIKSAVLSAQKAAEMIIKDAESSATEAKSEAEAVLSAAKSEAELIKEDARKQAIADSELLLSMTRDKAQEIIKKAKEEAGSIILNAKSSASDKVGAANRTVTSETLLFDMLKKEVSDFKASILSQYKAHIELISKLPELATEEANKLEANSENSIISPEKTAEIIEDVPVSESEASASDDEADEPLEFTDSFEEQSEVADTEERILAELDAESEEFSKSAAEAVFGTGDEKEEPELSKSTEETIEKFEHFPVTENESDENEPEETLATEEETVDTGFTMFTGSFNIGADDMSEASFFDADDEKEDVASVKPTHGSEDIPISGGFTINREVLERFENKAEVKEDDDNGEEKKRGFFKRRR